MTEIIQHLKIILTAFTVCYIVIYAHAFIRSIGKGTPNLDGIRFVAMLFAVFLYTLYLIIYY